MKNRIIHIFNSFNFIVFAILLGITMEWVYLDGTLRENESESIDLPLLEEVDDKLVMQANDIFFSKQIIELPTYFTSHAKTIGFTNKKESQTGFNHFEVPCTNPVNAGLDGAIHICNSSTDKILLHDLIQNENGGGIWSRISGTGGNFNVADASFIPASNASTSIFRYIVFGISPCPNDTSLAIITINKALFAGTDGNVSICDNNDAEINLFDFINLEDSGGNWYRISGTGGSFSSVTGIFKIGIGTSTSTFQYITNNKVPCTNDTSNVTIIMENSANAGRDTVLYICENSNQIIYLNEVLQNENSGGLWYRISGSLGAFNNLDGTFIPAIRTTNSVFMYVSYASFPCNNDTSYVAVNIISKYEAGLDGEITACANSFQAINLYDVITNEQKGGLWKRMSGSGGVFNATNASFIPTIGATESIFRYILASPNTCYFDTSYAKILIAGQVSAGNDGKIIFCDRSKRIVNLLELITNEQGGGSWTRIQGRGGILDLANASLIINDSFTTSVFQYIKLATPPCINDTSIATVEVPENYNVKKQYEVSFCESEAKQVKLKELISEQFKTGKWYRLSGIGGNFDASTGTFNINGADYENKFAYVVQNDSNCISDTIQLLIHVENKNKAGNDAVYITCAEDKSDIYLHDLIRNEESSGEWIMNISLGGILDAKQGIFYPDNPQQEILFKYIIPKTAICEADTSSLKIIFEQKNYAGEDTTIQICLGAILNINLSQILQHQTPNGKWIRWKGNDGLFDPKTSELQIKIALTDLSFAYIVQNNKACDPDTCLLNIHILRPNAGPDITIECLPLSQDDVIIMQAEGKGHWTELSINPSTINFKDYTSAISAVTNFSINGNYGFVWNTDAACVDTMYINILTDSIKPLIECPPDLTFQCAEDLKYEQLGLPIVSDNCPLNGFHASPTDIYQTICKNQLLLERTWIAMDEQGNKNNCVQHIEIKDEQIPNLICPENRIVFSGEPIEPFYLGSAIVFDNCNAVHLIFHDSQDSIDCSDIYRWWIAEDDCHNIDSCKQHIISQRIDIALNQKLITSPKYSYTQAMTFRIYIYNQGDVSIDKVEIAEHIPMGFKFDSALNPFNSWIKQNEKEYTTIFEKNIKPGQVDSLDIILVMQMTNGGLENWICRAEILDFFSGDIRLAEYDVDSKVNSSSKTELMVLPNSVYDDIINGKGEIYKEDEDDSDPAGPWIADLACIITNSKNNIKSFKDTINFPITIFNQGNTVCDHFEVKVQLPTGFIFDSSIQHTLVWKKFNNDIDFLSNFNLPPGDSITIPLVLIPNDVQGTNTYLNNWSVKSEIVSEHFEFNGNTLDDIDSRPDNNWSNDAGGKAIPDSENNMLKGSDDIIFGNGTGHFDDTDATTDEDDSDAEFVSCTDIALKINVGRSEKFIAEGDTVNCKLVIFNQSNVEIQKAVISCTIPEAYVLLDTAHSDVIKQGNNFIINYLHTIPVGDSAIICLSLLRSEINNCADSILEAQILNITTDLGITSVDIDSRFNENEEWKKKAILYPSWNDLITGRGMEYNEDEDDHDIEILHCSAGLSGKVWYDENENGVHDSLESEAPDIEVQLYNCKTIQLVQSTTTNNYGFYAFQHLDPRENYFIKILCPKKEYCKFTKANMGTNEAQDSDVDDHGIGPCLQFSNVTEYKDHDAGIVTDSRVGNFVWHDLNGNGLQENGENGIDNIVLYLIDVNTNSIVDSTLTDANGRYYFRKLKEGKYFLQANLNNSSWHVSQIKISFPLDNSDFYQQNNAIVTLPFLVHKNQQKLDLDLGLWECGQLQGNVWFDKNADGLYQSNEIDLNYLPVKLFNSNQSVSPQAIISNKIENERRSGYYLFDCIEPGTYFIQFPELRVFNSSPFHRGTDEQMDCDINNSNGLYTSPSYVITSGSKISHIDAGYIFSLNRKYNLNVEEDNLNTRTIQDDINYSKDNFRVYPNPVHDKLSINVASAFNESVDVSIKNLVGECTYLQSKVNTELNKLILVNTESFIQGTYILEISSINTQYQVLLVKI